MDTNISLQLDPNNSMKCFTGDLIRTLETLIDEDLHSKRTGQSSWVECPQTKSLTSNLIIRKNRLEVSGFEYHPHPSSLVTRRRFLAAPYTGTGYLPTVICPAEVISKFKNAGKLGVDTNSEDLSDTSHRSN
ncbi:hypothetical protein QAD02_013367 [Eretmocerus hayati]|uniref:Uncharacterized protein n=1 Tax=Eretmocerus hayati TaxID=131215 RepID=A0ACC2P723_9HYME|nr:hypothetical protein QAD02_013367 [Eretmocerus hayati]